MSVVGVVPVVRPSHLMRRGCCAVSGRPAAGRAGGVGGRAGGLLASALVAFVALPRPLAAHDGGVIRPGELWSSWSFEPLVVLGLALSAGLYTRGVFQLWSRAGRGRGVRGWQVACFAAGWAVAAVSLVSPLDALGGTLFSAHMAQHELLMRVAAPLLVLAAPLPALLWGLPPAGRRRVGAVGRVPAVRRPWRLLTRPAMAWSLHALALWAWHVPALYQLTLTSDLAHGLQHTSFVLTALLFWWVLVHQGRRGRIAYGIGVLYVFASAAHQSFLGVLFTFARHVWYPAYDPLAVVDWGLTPLQDQQLAGLIMWVPGGLIYLAAALALFAAWLRAIERERLRMDRSVRAAQEPRRAAADDSPPTGVTGPTGATERTGEGRGAGAAGERGSGPGDGATRILLALAFLPVLAGCSGVQTILDPAGRGASHVAWLWWGMLVTSTALWVVLAFFVLYGTAGARVAPEDREAMDRAALRWVGAGVGITAVVLLAVFVASLWISRDSRRLAGTETLTVEVVGHQFWWEVRYVDPATGDTVVSANELHLPVDRTARLEVRSADVIHSLWIPNLEGKIDMIPGRTNVLLVHPDRVGEYRGQCAEFCGQQHANMALTVEVHPPGEFQPWLAREAAPAAPPADSSATHGLAVFQASQCADCHTIRGTGADGTGGPDLTHVASRRTLAAGMFPNTRGHLGGWISNPQRIKPGNLMPFIRIPGDDMHAVLDYLEGLR